jgi:hypothetical protein
MGMKYRRLLVLTTAGSDPRPAFAALKRLLPSLERVTVVAQQPTPHVAWLALAAPPEYSETMAAAVDALLNEARQVAVDVDIRLASDLTLDALSALIASTATDLVALDSTARDSLRLAAQVRKRSGVALLYLPQIMPPGDPVGGLLCVALSARERWAIATFLQAHAEAADRAVLLSSTPIAEEDILQIREVAGFTPAVDPAAANGTLRQLLAGELGSTSGLIVLPRFPPLLLLPRRRGLPVLVLPPLRATGTEWERRLDVPDLVDDGRSASFDVASGTVPTACRPLKRACRCFAPIRDHACCSTPSSTPRVCGPCAARRGLIPSACGCAPPAVVGRCASDCAVRDSRQS